MPKHLAIRLLTKLFTEGKELVLLCSHVGLDHSIHEMLLKIENNELCVYYNGNSAWFFKSYENFESFLKEWKVIENV